jgi:predicted small lipoprotein YifL
MNARHVMRPLLALVAIATIAACSQIGPGTSPSPTEDASMESDTPSPLPSIDPGFASPTERAGSGGRDEVAGVFGADSVEGGCTYLEADDGTRFQVIYPTGWNVQATPLQLTDPSGDVVATGGERITVRGSRADDMVSICMIGPMFRASEVVSID